MDSLQRIKAKIEARRRKEEEKNIKDAKANRVPSEEDYVSRNACVQIGTLKMVVEETN